MVCRKAKPWRKPTHRPGRRVNPPANPNSNPSPAPRTPRSSWAIPAQWADRDTWVTIAPPTGAKTVTIINNQHTRYHTHTRKIQEFRPLVDPWYCAATTQRGRCVNQLGTATVRRLPTYDGQGEVGFVNRRGKIAKEDVVFFYCTAHNQASFRYQQPKEPGVEAPYIDAREIKDDEDEDEEESDFERFDEFEGFDDEVEEDTEPNNVDIPGIVPVNAAPMEQEAVEDEVAEASTEPKDFEVPMIRPVNAPTLDQETAENDADFEAAFKMLRDEIYRSQQKLYDLDAVVLFGEPGSLRLVFAETEKAAAMARLEALFELRAKAMIARARAPTGVPLG